MRIWRARSSSSVRQQTHWPGKASTNTSRVLFETSWQRPLAQCRLLPPYNITTKLGVKISPKPPIVASWRWRAIRIPPLWCSREGGTQGMGAMRGDSLGSDLPRLLEGFRSLWFGRFRNGCEGLWRIGCRGGDRCRRRPGKDGSANEQVVCPAIFGDRANNGPFKLSGVVGDLSHDSFQIQVLQPDEPGFPFGAKKDDAVMN